MTQIIPSKALAVLAEDVRLLEQGTLEQPPDYTQYRDDPVAFCRDVLHTSLWSKQAEIAYAVRDHYRTAARTCNSGGKTHALAAISLWWIFGRGGLVLMTSATLRSAVGQYVQREVRRLFTRGKFPTSAELFESYLKIDNEFRLVAMVSSAADNLQGWHHNAGVLAIIDEASGVQRSALHALESCLEDPARDRILVSGNPLPTGNFFRGLFAPSSGWHQIHISAFDCPAYTGEGEPPRVGKAPAWIAEQKRKGEHDVEYVARVLGEFPEVQSINALYDRKQLERAIANHADGARRQAVAELPLVIAVDVEHANDRTVALLAQGLYGHEVRIFPPVGGNTIAIAAELIALAKEIDARREFDPTDQLAYGWSHGGYFVVDTIGNGQGVADQLESKGHSVVRYSAQAVLPPGEKTRFQNPRARSGWALRDALMENLVALPPSQELLEELLALRYEIKSSGKIVLGPKDAVRDLISRSPDLADVAMMGLGGEPETCTIGGSDAAVDLGF